MALAGKNGSMGWLFEVTRTLKYKINVQIRDRSRRATSKFFADSPIYNSDLAFLVGYCDLQSAY